MQEIVEIPTRDHTVRKAVAKIERHFKVNLCIYHKPNFEWSNLPIFVFVVIGAEHLHAHHSENEDDNAEHKGQISKVAHRFAHDRNEQVQSGPRFRQFEHSQLQQVDQ
jgi:L-lysine 2,3-aminomutase